MGKLNAAKHVYNGKYFIVLSKKIPYKSTTLDENCLKRILLFFETILFLQILLYVV